MEEYNYEGHMTIKEFPEEERPVEKLLKIGERSLSDAELLAIILGSGSRNITAISLAYQLINSQKEGLRFLYGATIDELSEFKGIGIVKVARIKAALELGRRLSIKSPVNTIIQKPLDIVDFLKEEMKYLSQEHFNAVLLNTKNMVLDVENITKGIVNASLVHPREVFKNAIRKNSTSIILVHNHPSGDPTPSNEDKSITERLFKAGEIIGIKVIDHIIIGGENYISFKEMGML